MIGDYRRPWHIEKSSGMSETISARPIFHQRRESIDGHLPVVFAGLAVTRRIEARTVWSIKKPARTAREHRTNRAPIKLRTIKRGCRSANGHRRGPVPTEICHALALITGPACAHQFEPSRE